MHHRLRYENIGQTNFVRTPIDKKEEPKITSKSQTNSIYLFNIKTFLFRSFARFCIIISLLFAFVLFCFVLCFVGMNDSVSLCYKSSIIEKRCAETYLTNENTSYNKLRDRFHFGCQCYSYLTIVDCLFVSISIQNIQPSAPTVKQNKKNFKQTSLCDSQDEGEFYRSNHFKMAYAQRSMLDALLIIFV